MVVLGKAFLQNTSPMEPEAEKPKTCSCKCKKHAAVFFIILLLAGIVCWHVHHVPRPPRPPIGPEPGTACTVQFHRGALGGAAALPISPMTQSINGAKVSISGELIAIDHEAIIISSEQRRYWIPKHSILLIEYIHK